MKHEDCNKKYGNESCTVLLHYKDALHVVLCDFV